MDTLYICKGIGHPNKRKTPLKYFPFCDGLCGSHTLRELQALEETNIRWASWFRRYLMRLYRISVQGKGELNEQQKLKTLLLFEHIWKAADQIEPLPKKNPPKEEAQKPQRVEIF